MQAALLPDRGVVKVAGDDARRFLNGLVTNDMTKVTPADPCFAALLTPQGKIIVDFMIAEAPTEDGGGFFLDCPRALAGTLVEKLISPGQLLQAGTTPAFTVANLSRVWVMAQVLGTDLATVHVGDTARWTNADFVAHTATARNGAWDAMIPAHGNASIVLDRAGTFDYYCKFHPNMTGQITVTQ